MTDTIKIITCPACGKEMTKLYSEELKCNIDICVDGCGGIWLDNYELKKVDEQHENIDEILELIKNKTFEKVDTSLDRMCPICGTKMVKHFVSAKHEIEIDDCYSCGGKFFDNEELQKMRTQYKTEKERADAVKAVASATYGGVLQKLDIENAELQSNRSGLFKIYMKLCGFDD